MTARTIEDVLLGEAVSGSRSKRMADMIAIASAIRNRMDRGRATVDQIIAAPGQFSAYGRALPKGVEQYRELARKAWSYVQKAGPTHSAMFYATPAATKNLPKGLQRVTSSTGHVFFSDPQNRAIQTTQGYVQPTPVSTATAATQVAAMRAAGFPASARRSAGMLELTPSLIPNIDYGPLSAPGKGRSQIPTSGIADKVAAAANSVIPGTTTSLWSGMEPAGRPPVNSPYRHPLGYAGDFDFYGPNKARITDPVALQDIAMTMASQHNANIGYGETGYMGKGRMHIDTMPLSIAPGAGPQWGRTAAGPWAENLNFARQTGIGPTPYSNAPTPSPRAQAIAEQEQTVREIGARGGMAKGLGAAGIGNVGGKPLEEERDPEISRYEERRRNADANRAAASTSAPQGGSYDSAYAGLRVGQAPIGPMQNTSPNIAELAAERRLSNTSAITRPPNIPPQLTAAMPLGPAQSFQPGAQPQPAFVAGNVPMPPGIPAPPLNAPRMVTPRPVGPINEGQFPAAPTPQNYRPADVYAGRANSAQDSFGNTVSRDAAGNIGITNRFGATTYSRDGLTTAAGLGGPLGEIDTSRFGAPDTGDLGNRLNDRIGEAFEVDPSTGRSRFGNATRQFGGSMAGAYIGGLGGPLGSLLGAAIGQELAKPKGGAIGDFMRGVRTIDTSRVPGFGNFSEFARPVGGLGFPNAPGGGSGNPRESNRSDREMREISPRAARDISRGRGGLY